MKKYIEAVNKMSSFSFHLLCFCLALVLCSVLASFLYGLLCGEYERQIMRLFWARDLQYIFTSLSVAFGGAVVMELQCKQDGR